jgi:hypothetical protein
MHAVCLCHCKTLAPRQHVAQASTYLLQHPAGPAPESLHALSPKTRPGDSGARARGRALCVCRKASPRAMSSATARPCRCQPSRRGLSLRSRSLRMATSRLPLGRYSDTHSICARPRPRSRPRRSAAPGLPLGRGPATRGAARSPPADGCSRVTAGQVHRQARQVRVRAFLACEPAVRLSCVGLNYGRSTVRAETQEQSQHPRAREAPRFQTSMWRACAHGQAHCARETARGSASPGSKRSAPQALP